MHAHPSAMPMPGVEAMLHAKIPTCPKTDLYNEDAAENMAEAAMQKDENARKMNGQIAAMQQAMADIQAKEKTKYQKRLKKVKAKLAKDAKKAAAKFKQDVAEELIAIKAKLHNCNKRVNDKAKALFADWKQTRLLEEAQLQVAAAHKLCLKIGFPHTGGLIHFLSESNKITNLNKMRVVKTRAAQTTEESSSD